MERKKIKLSSPREAVAEASLGALAAGERAAALLPHPQQPHTAVVAVVVVEVPARNLYASAKLRSRSASRSYSGGRRT